MATSQTENCVAKASASESNLIFKFQTSFLKGSKGISTKNFCPLVGVVPGGITTGEDVAKATQELIFGDRKHHRCGLSNLAAKLIWGNAEIWCPATMQAQISESEMHLAQSCQTGIKGAAGAQFCELLLRKRFASTPVTCHPHQRGAIEAPVLHELARQFHCVPFHVVDSCSLWILNGREHVLKAMAELMEQSLHLIEAHQTWCLCLRWSLVTNQIGHRKNRLALEAFAACQAFVHPCPPSLAGWSAIGIEVERCQV